MPKKLDPKPRPRPDVHRPEAAESEAGARLNKARIAFETYKKRVAAPAGHAEAAGHAVPPYAYPLPPGMPTGPFVPPNVMPAWPAPAPGAKPAGSLVESLGTLLHLSIQAINAGLAGGIALMQGSPSPWEAEHECGCHDRCGCGCEDNCCRPHHGWDCGSCCHPSVHGC